MQDIFINELSQDLDMEEFITSKEPFHYTLTFEDNVVIEVVKSNDSYLFKANIAEIPKVNSESFLLRLMEANLFGLGTRGSAIGLDEKENQSTLSLEVDANQKYQNLKNQLEDFANVIDFWRKESLNHH
ncbi:MAG: type III secretion system chaperone [Parachlamydiaceae bacterium]|nr:type III secretion system chaperone [Parachlamydiaceae bacterium]